MSVDPIRDPEGCEPSHLTAASQLAGSRVIEIGCGNGRLTRRYASLPKEVVGVDPDLADLRKARKDLPVRAPQAHLVCAKAESLPFKPHEFEVAIFAWSL